MKKCRFSLLVLASSLALHASSVPCSTPGLDPATLSGANTCTLGPVTYSNADLQFMGFNSVLLNILNASFTDDSAVLDVGVTTDPNPVTTPGAFWALSIDADVPDGTYLDSVTITNTASDGVLFTEDACAGEWQGYGCVGTYLGGVHVLPGQTGTLDLGGDFSHVSYLKQGRFGDASEAEWVEQDHVAPEPGTWVSLGTGVGLIFMSRFTKRRKMRS